MAVEVIGLATHANMTGFPAQHIRGNRGFLGTATNTPVWRSDIKRWVRPALSAGADTLLGTNTNPNPIPVYLLPGSPPAKWTLVDELRIQSVGGVGAKTAFFGVARLSGGAQLRETIGFSCAVAGGAIGNWLAKVQADDGTVVIGVDLGVSASALHELMLVLNGITRMIEWYVDRVKKHEAALPANTGAMLNANEPHIGIRVSTPDAGNPMTMDCETYGTGGFVTVER